MVAQPLAVPRTSTSAIHPSRLWLAFVVTLVALVALNAPTVRGFNAVAELTRQAKPQVIGHAGASGYVPESSIIGYDLAANLLADYSEPDLVLTKDNYFVGKCTCIIISNNLIMCF
jgi:hypothetical protein